MAVVSVVYKAGALELNRQGEHGKDNVKSESGELTPKKVENLNVFP